MATIELPIPSVSTVRAAASPIRVCHVSLTLQTGGLERILADLARRHHRDDFRLSFVAMRAVGRFAEDIWRAGCDVYQLKSRGRFGQVRELAQWLRREQIDVVHTHNTYPHVYASLAARWAGVPVVVQTRHGQRAGHGWKSRVLYRAATSFVDRVVAVSDDAARLCVDADRLRADKVLRIWNGIDLSEFQYHGPADAPIAISVARLSREKDFPTLLRAVALAAVAVPDLRLKIVGDGPERQSLEQLSAELGLTGRVEFLGERTDVSALLPTAGFFVTASSTEGISLTLLEAMAVGLPVVATDAGGNREIVVDGETGLITPVGVADRLAEAISQMCRRRGDWPAFGRLGRERVCQHFDIRRMVDDYESLYESLLQRHQEQVSSRRRPPSAQSAVGAEA